MTVTSVTYWVEKIQAVLMNFPNFRNILIVALWLLHHFFIPWLLRLAARRLIYIISFLVLHLTLPFSFCPFPINENPCLQLSISIAKACKSLLVDDSLVLSTDLYLWKSIRGKAIGSGLEHSVFLIELVMLLEYIMTRLTCQNMTLSCCRTWWTWCCLEYVFKMQQYF